MAKAYKFKKGKDKDDMRKDYNLEIKKERVKKDGNDVVISGKQRGKLKVKQDIKKFMIGGRNLIESVRIKVVID